MDNLAAQIAAAKKAGYSENEILQHISQDAHLGPQIQQAVKSGYSAPDIIAHLMQPPSITDTALKYSAGSGPANLLDMPGRGVVAAANLATMGAGYLGNKLGILSPSQMPNTIDPNLLDVANPAFRKMGLINDQYAPDSAGGRIADFTTQALTGGGLNPAAIARNAARNMVKPIVRDVAATTASGLGAGGANAFTNNIDTGNDTLNNAIKIGATLAGGTLAGGTVAARGTAGDRAAAAIKGITPEEMAIDRALKRKAAEMGSPITDYEAIQARTGVNPKMQTQQRLSEQSDAAATTLTPMMQNRPQANRTMFDNAVNGISPLAQYPDSLAGLLQQAARDSLQKVKEFRTNVASPDYRAQRASDIEAMNLNDAIPGLNAKIADRLMSRDNATRIGGQFDANANEQGNIANSIINNYPELTAVSNLAREKEYGGVSQDAANIARQRYQEAQAYQDKLNQTQDALAAKNLPYIGNKVGSFVSQLNSDIRAAGPTQEGKILQSFKDEIAPNGSPIVLPSQLESVYKANRNKLDLGLSPTDIQKTQAGVLGPYVRNLDDLIQEVSPAIKQGRQIYSQVSKDIVNPMDASQVGKLARSDDFKQQSETFLPKDPADVNPAVVMRTANAIGEQSPDILRQFLAQDLRRKYDSATRDTLSGELPTAGAGFAKNVAGTDSQEANLMAAIQASGAPTAPFSDALSIFRAQGMRPPVNSATFSNADEASKAGGLLSALSSPTRAIPNFMNAWRNGLASEDIAKAISAQDASGPLRIEELARANGAFDPMKQQMLINALMAGQANQ